MSQPRWTSWDLDNWIRHNAHNVLVLTTALLAIAAVLRAA